MKKIFSEIIWGKNRFNGVFALVIVGSIILGCECNKQIGSTPDSSNTSTSNTTGGPSKNSPFSKDTGKDTTDKDTTNDGDSKDTNYTKADASKKEVPSDAEMQEMAKATLLDFNDALQAADFSDFYNHISKAWQKQTSPDKLKQGFQAFIDGKTDISNIKPMEATFTSAPAVSKNLGYDMLMVKGEYPTSPIKTTFELNYVPEGKEWKLALIRVYAAIKK